MGGRRMARTLFLVGAVLSEVATSVVAAEPSAEAARELWCMAAFAAAAEHAESIGDKAGTEALTPLIDALGRKSAALLEAEGFTKEQQTALGRAFVDKALENQRSGVFSYTQEECLDAANG